MWNRELSPLPGILERAGNENSFFRINEFKKEKGGLKPALSHLNVSQSMFL
jgi:hypothetical protein